MTFDWLEYPRFAGIRGAARTPLWSKGAKGSSLFDGRGWYDWTSTVGKEICCFLGYRLSLDVRIERHISSKDGRATDDMGKTSAEPDIIKSRSAVVLKRLFGCICWSPTNQTRRDFAVPMITHFCVWNRAFLWNYYSLYSRFANIGLNSSSQ
jgi:hypothetical protein